MVLTLTHSVIQTLDSTALLYKPLDRVMKTTLVLHVRFCLRSHLTFIDKYSFMPMDLLAFFSVLLRTYGSTRLPITPTASRCRKRFVSPAASCLGSMNGRNANVLSSSAEERYSPPHVPWFLICRFLFNFIIKLYIYILHKNIRVCACPQRRQLMRDGFVVDVCENGHNLRHLFLYTDMLLCAKLTNTG